jgi:hypothetical protein
LLFRPGVSCQEETFEVARLASTGRLALACALHLHQLLERATAAALRAGLDSGDAVELRGLLVRSKEVTRQLLTIGGRPPADSTLVDLGELLEEMRPLIAMIAGPDAFVVVVRDVAGVVALAERGALEQIVLNLVCRATTGTRGRRIAVTSGRVEWAGGALPSGEVIAAGAYATLTISDELDRRSDVFVAPCATCGHVPALGLSIVAAIARASGGALIVHDDAGAIEHRVLIPTL